MQNDFSAVNLIGYNLYEITQIIIKERDQAKHLRKSTPGQIGQIQLLNANKRASSHIKLNASSKLDDRAGGGVGTGTIGVGSTSFSSPFAATSSYMGSGI